jgi:hypothetical protein
VVRDPRCKERDRLELPVLKQPREPERRPLRRKCQQPPQRKHPVAPDVPARVRLHGSAAAARRRQRARRGPPLRIPQDRAGLRSCHLGARVRAAAHRLSLFRVGAGVAAAVRALDVKERGRRRGRVPEHEALWPRLAVQLACGHGRSTGLSAARAHERRMALHASTSGPPAPTRVRRVRTEDEDVGEEERAVERARARRGERRPQEAQVRLHRGAAARLRSRGGGGRRHLRGAAGGEATWYRKT